MTDLLMTKAEAKKVRLDRIEKMIWLYSSKKRIPDERIELDTYIESNEAGVDVIRTAAELRGCGAAACLAGEVVLEFPRGIQIRDKFGAIYLTCQSTGLGTRPRAHASRALGLNEFTAIDLDVFGSRRHRGMTQRAEILQRLRRLRKIVIKARAS